MSNYGDFLKKKKLKKEMFYQTAFDGLDFKKASNKYYEIEKRVSEDETKILVNADASHIFATKYGYGLIVGRDRVVWLNDWQVFTVADWFQTEFTRGTYQVLLSKDYYKPVKSNREFEGICVGDCESDSEFEKANCYHSWDDMLDIAKAQETNSNSPIKFKL